MSRRLTGGVAVKPQEKKMPGNGRALYSLRSPHILWDPWRVVRQHPDGLQTFSLNVCVP